MPIESRNLIHPDPLQAQRNMGSIRYWVDMLPEQDSYRHVQFRDAHEVEFEVRVKIIGIKGISVFKDLGERNDVYIKGRFTRKSPGKLPVVQQKKTDTHRWARYNADFNWQWVFNISAPMSYCSLQLNVMDEDTLTENDMIYGSKVLPFDHAMLLAMESEQQGKEPMGVIKHQVIFDTYPAGRDGEGTDRDIIPMRVWRCCRRVTLRRPRPPPDPATLHLEVEILTAQEARLRPMEDNCCFMEPKTRSSWQTALADPGAFFIDFIGPTQYMTLRRTGTLCFIAVSVLIFLAIIWLLMQAILLPILAVHDSTTGSRLAASVEQARQEP